MESIRLNKYLSGQGVCSRREADRLIQLGKVTIDGRTAQMGEKVTGQEEICCEGKPVGTAGRGEAIEPLLSNYQPRPKPGKKGKKGGKR